MEELEREMKELGRKTNEKMVELVKELGLVRRERDGCVEEQETLREEVRECRVALREASDTQQVCFVVLCGSVLQCVAV